MPRQPPRPAEPARKPLFQPGGYVREQVHVTADGEPVPRFSDVYTLDEQPLGEGRYSRVYAATHRGTGARRAVKTAMRRGPNTKIVDLGMECPGRLARHEADILKGLDHPNVIRLYEVYEEAEAVHLVLELCEGSDVLERILVSKGRLPEHEIGQLFVQMLYAVWHLHCRGVVHRDLKPEHFLFTRREPDREPNPPKFSSLKVIDFGLSHLAGANFVPLGGTPQFMPPEIINGQAPSQELSDRVDMWALGVVLHAMLVGHYPSPHLTDKTQAQYFAKSAWSSISKECLDLLGQLLRQAPANRPTVAQALQHPWAQNAATARGLPNDAMVARIPSAVRAYSAAPALQKLALIATAHDLDDFDYYGLRLIFQALLVSSEGKLTKQALRAIADRDGPWSKVASALAQGSSDVSPSGPISASGGGSEIAFDWKELLAAAALGGAPEAAKAAPGSKNGSGAGASGGGAAGGLPRLNEDAVWRAFDLLSLSTGEISGATLRRLLAYKPPGPKGGLGIRQEAAEDKDSGLYDRLYDQRPEIAQSEAEFEAAAGALAGPEALERAVWEYFPRTEAVPRSQFLAVVTGEVKPQQRSAAGGGGGLLACFKCFQGSGSGNRQPLASDRI